MVKLIDLSGSRLIRQPNLLLGHPRSIHSEWHEIEVSIIGLLLCVQHLVLMEGHLCLGQI